MARTATITTAKLTPGTRVLVEVGVTTIPARRKTGVTTARVISTNSYLVQGTGHRAVRVYDVVTSAGTVSGVFGVQTFWLAPEDTAAVNRAHDEAMAEDAERPAAAPVAPAQPEVQGDSDDLESMTFAQVMELAKALKVPGRGVARLPQLRAGVRQARLELAG